MHTCVHARTQRTRQHPPSLPQGSNRRFRASLAHLHAVYTYLAAHRAEAGERLVVLRDQPCVFLPNPGAGQPTLASLALLCEAPAVWAPTPPIVAEKKQLKMKVDFFYCLHGRTMQVRFRMRLLLFQLFFFELIFGFFVLIVCFPIKIIMNPSIK